MNMMRCGFCGMETAAAYCPRCKARVAPQPTAASYERARGGRSGGGSGASGGRALRRLIALALLCAVGGAVYHFRHRIMYGPDAPYVVAIRDAEQFKAPLTLTVKKSVTAADFGGGVQMMSPVGEPVHILLARGLVQFGAPSTEERVVGTITGVQASLNAVGAPTTEVEMKQNYSTTTASLTPKGREAAASGWTDTGAAWGVPIGTRYFNRLVKVGEAKTDAAGVETREVEFSWRWTPNGVGEAFDPGAKFYPALPERAHAAAEAMRWSSLNSYRAVARLERRAGGDWRVAEIKSSEAFDKRKELSAF